MNAFAVVFLCVQACLFQNVFSQCTSRAAVAAEPGLIASAGLAAPYGLAAPLAGPAAAPFGYRAGIAELGYPGAGLAAPYGGAGEGNVAVAGELPVAGRTAVVGQVPIMGAVSFNGPLPATGAVSIDGRCACGCGASYVY